MSQFPSFRSQFVAKRTYNRPLDEDGKTFETFTQTIDRVINHQKWLWETAKGKLIGEDIDELTEEELSELEELRQLMLNYEAMVAGRTLWLGGTDISKKFHATQFNCSFSEIKTVHDLVDAYHNLLLGCGVGLEPITGILNGFTKPVEIEVIRSTRNNRGDDNNKERHYKRGDKRVWQLIIGDSGIAWAKAIGKLVAMKKPVDIIILDFSEVRPGGKPLKGFGWISSGDEQISKAFYEIALILNRRAGQLLSKIDILDIMNWLGTSLSSRRSAEIAIMPADDPEAEEFAGAKKDYWKTGNPQRSQSNNSLVFYHKPTKRELRGLFSQMLDAGGSEPGFINGAAARKRAPYFRGVNPSLRKGTKVLTANGIYPIEELQDKDCVVPNLHAVNSPAKCFLSGNDKPLYKIELQGGYVYYATAEHKWPVYKKYDSSHNQISGKVFKKETIELKSGDYIPYTRVNKLFDGVGGTRDEGFFIGWLLGDGWVTIRSDNKNEQIGLIIGNDDSSVLPELIRILQSFGCNATFRPSTKGDSVELNTVNKKLSDILNNCGWNGKTKLPSLVWTGTEEFRKGFIDGLISSDGTIEKKHGRIGFGSKNKSLVNDVQDLLGFYGIPMSCEYRMNNVTFPNGNSGEYEYYTCRSIGGAETAVHFSSVFDLTNVRKNNILKSIVVKRKYLPKLMVVNVELTELKEDVWDLTVYDETHCFRLPGVVTGNCGEILLGDKSYCNLITINLNKFNGREKELHRAFWIMGRANYRQTCVDFRDDILQTTWHELNQFLHLTGMSCAGIVTWEHHKSPKHIAELRKIARCAVDSMAEELNLPKSKAVTCGKPDGSIGKIMDTTEGIHKPLSKYILNNIIISKSSPLLQVAIDSGYRCFEHPFDNSSMVVSLPICFENVEFDTVEINGKIMEVNLESAIDQLNRYKMWMDNFADHNISITVSYSPDEVEDIVDWLHSNWDHFVGVSFLLRADPTKTAEDLGYPYLPQQPITKEEYYEYVSKLKEVNLDSVFVNSLEELTEDCSTGMCPLR